MKKMMMLLIMMGTLSLSSCDNSPSGPSPIVENVMCEKNFQGMNVVTETNVLVSNQIVGGNVVVEAELITTSGATFSDTQTIYLGSGESKYVNFIFDVSWNEKGTCKAHAWAD